MVLKGVHVRGQNVVKVFLHVSGRPCLKNWTDEAIRNLSAGMSYAKAPWWHGIFLARIVIARRRVELSRCYGRSTKGSGLEAVFAANGRS